MPTLSLVQDPRRLESVAAAQDGVVSRDQLRCAGFDADAVRWRTSRGNWQIVGRAVVLCSGPLTRRQREWVAVLSAGPVAALAGRSAAAAHGLRGFDSDVIDVLVPHSARPAQLPFVRWRRCRTFTSSDFGNFAGPPLVARDRAVADAACWSEKPRVACGIVASAVQQRLVTARMIRAELIAMPRARHRGVLLPVLADIEGGADSLSEIDFCVLARRAGLPPPIRQSIRCDSDGRRRFLDADFGTFAVEVDGSLHFLALNYWADTRRQNELVLGGDRILRFPSVAIRLESDIVVDQLSRAGARFGVVGTLG